MPVWLQLAPQGWPEPRSARLPNRNMCRPLAFNGSTTERTCRDASCPKTAHPPQSSRCSSHSARASRCISLSKPDRLNRRVATRRPSSATARPPIRPNAERPKRLAVTPELLRTAFHDDLARDLLGHARRARLTLDSSLKSYDANVRERFTAKLGIGSRGPERVMYRQENASRVQWQDGVGARVEVTGARVGIPVAPPSAEREALEEGLRDGGMSTIPYFPGQESFGLGGRLAREQVDDRGVVQPLAEGAEAYYTYATGDSMKWTLPGGRIVSLRELTIRPRSPKWNLAVGSLWFDTQTGQLVRAAYRLAVPLDVWAVGEANARDARRRRQPAGHESREGAASRRFRSRSRR